MLSSLLTDLCPSFSGADVAPIVDGGTCCFLTELDNYVHYEHLEKS